MGSIQGIRKSIPDIKIIYIDAHLDAHTPSTSDSGNMHGMPLGILAGEEESEINPCITMKDVCFFGIRSYEPAEMDLIKERKVLCYLAEDCKIDRLQDMKKEIETYF